MKSRRQWESKEENPVIFPPVCNFTLEKTVAHRSLILASQAEWDF